MNRGKWVAIAAVAALAVGFAVFLFFRSRGPRAIRIAAGAKGGQGHVFAEALAAVVASGSSRLRIVVVETSGAADNLGRLERGEVHLAIAQNDLPTPDNARAVAFLYPQLFHLVVAEDSPIQRVADLRGRRVGTPPAGGGSYRSFVALSGRHGLALGDMQVSNLASSELSRKFLSRELEAVFRVDTIGDSGLREILSPGGARLVSIDQAAAMRLEHPYLDSFTIPTGAYSANPPVPAADVTTVGVDTMLLAGVATDDALVGELTRTLFERQRDLAARAPVAMHIRSPLESSVLTAAIHDGARSYYDREKPGFLVVYSEVIGLLITLAGIGGSLVLALRARFSAKRKDRADRYNIEIVALLDEAKNASGADAIAAAEEKLLALFKRVVADLDREQVDPDTLHTFTLTWQTVMATLRHRESMLAK